MEEKDINFRTNGGFQIGGCEFVGCDLDLWVKIHKSSLSQQVRG